MRKVKPRKPRGSGLTKIKYRLSPELSELIGEKVTTRANITKKMWDYIKKHKLQDPDEKRWIIPDKKFAKVFGKDRIFMFDLPKVISKHVSAVR